MATSDPFLELSDTDYILMEELPVCGCGRPDLVYELYRTLLRSTPPTGASTDDWHATADRQAAADNDERLFYTAAYVLDSIEATEHGGGVDGAWRTAKGTRLLAILDRYAETGYDAIPTIAADAHRDNDATSE